jgi:hypothetical protein
VLTFFTFLVSEVELTQTLFLNESDLVENERLKTFLRKDSYYKRPTAVQRDEETKRRRPESPGRNGKSPPGHLKAAGAEPHKDGAKAVQYKWQPTKPKKKKEKPYWEDY